MGGGEAGGGGGWVAGGRLNPPLELFGLARVPDVPAIGPNMRRWRKRHLPIIRVNFRPIASM